MQNEIGSTGFGRSLEPGPTEAVIVPFPARIPGRVSGSETLSGAGPEEALSRLGNALAEQREAIEAWRRANAALAAAVRTLSATVTGLEIRLAAVASPLARESASLGYETQSAYHDRVDTSGP